MAANMATTADGRTAFDYLSTSGSTIPGARSRELGVRLRELDCVRACHWLTYSEKIRLSVTAISGKMTRILEEFDASVELGEEYDDGTFDLLVSR